MKVDVYQCHDESWRNGLWCGRIHEDTHGMSVYRDTEDEARTQIIEAWEAEQRRMEEYRGKSKV